MKSIIVLIIGSLLIIAGCAVKISDVVVKQTIQYKYFQEQNGLKIAIDPFFEEDRLKEFFGTDLLSHGILPVLIIIENHNPKSGYLLDKKIFSIVMKVEQNFDTKEGVDPSISIPKEVDAIKASALVIGGVGAIIAPGLVLIPSLPMLIYADKKEVDHIKINDSLMRKAFIDRTIFPGESHSGFVYFQLKDRETAQNVGIVLIKAKHIPSNKELDFVFQIKK